MHEPRAYESAYPGSMFSHPDGGYIERDDPVSLAAALLEHITTLKQEVEDLKAVIEAERKEKGIVSQHRLTVRY